MLAIGAHPDDIEIGCGGTILKLIEEAAVSEVRWVVLSGEGERAQEARRSAEALLEGVPGSDVVLCDFPDGFFPYEGQRIKDFFEQLKADFSPDVVFTHQRADLHQDHRTDLRADLEHLPRPPDPRVRGAEVRRRHERAERLRPARRAPSAGARSST